MDAICVIKYDPMHLNNNNKNIWSNNLRTIYYLLFSFDFILFSPAIDSGNSQVATEILHWAKSEMIWGNTERILVTFDMPS